MLNWKPTANTPGFREYHHAHEWEFYSNPLARVASPEEQSETPYTHGMSLAETAGDLDYLQRSEVSETVENGPDWQTIEVFDYNPADVSELVQDMRNLAEVAWRALVETHAHIERMSATAKRPLRHVTAQSMKW